MRSQFKASGVECRNLRDVCNLQLQASQMTPFAVLHSDFKQVLLLNPDTLCTRDPGDIFEHPIFRKCGAVFWPDYWKINAGNPMWQIVGADPGDPAGRIEVDEGQMLIDKSGGWQALNLCAYFHEHAGFYRRLIELKDAFRFAWAALGCPFFMMNHEPGTCGHTRGASQFIGTTVVQHDFSGNILFLRRNLLPWDVTINAELLWREIRNFKHGATKKEYFRDSHRRNGIDLRGDVETKSFESVFPTLERDCLNVLNEVRESVFYRELLTDYYINAFRGWHPE
jgi:alpha 1,2-mannosyltransferase